MNQNKISKHDILTVIRRMEKQRDSCKTAWESAGHLNLKIALAGKRLGYSHCIAIVKAKFKGRLELTK